jgi:RHS repeat-associated protein
MFVAPGGFTTPAALTPRDGVAMAYDPDRHVFVMFGGYDGTNYLAQTWLYYPTASGDTGTWVQQSPAMSPPARYVASAVWDGYRHRVMIFGGVNGANTLGDAFEWTGSTWVAMPAGPGTRWGNGLSYDSSSGQIVLFGGCRGSSILGDTWVFDGVSQTWMQRAQAPAPAPTARCAFGQTYDTATGQTLLFGGYSGAVLDSDTWSWSGSAWSQVATTGPSARDYVLMDYDSDAGEPVLYGGYNAGATYNDTWRWDGTRWDSYPGLAAPPGRYASALAYDSTDGQHMFFGGFGVANNAVGLAAASYLNDTWVASHATPTLTQQVSAAGVSGAYSAGQTVTITLTIGNPSNFPRTVLNVPDFLPPGLTATGTAMSASSLTVPCSAVTRPSCVLTPRRVQIGGIDLPANGSQAFTLTAVVNPAGNGAGAAACQSTASFAPQGAATSFYAAQVLADQPTGYYRMDDTGTTLTDASGHALNGALSGAVSTGATGALASDPDPSTTFSGGQAVLPAGVVPANITASGGFTFDTWVKPTDVVSNAVLFDAWSSTSTDGTNDDMRLTRDGSSNGLAFTMVTPGQTFTAIAPNALQLNTWQHLQVVAKPVPGTTSALFVAIYRNGSLAGAGGNVNAAPVALRDQVRLAAGSFHGGMDDTAFFPSNLENTFGVQAHDAAARGTGLGGNVAGVVVQNSGSYRNVLAGDFDFLWELGEAAGPTALDSGGLGYNATYSSTGVLYGQSAPHPNYYQPSVTLQAASSGYVTLQSGGTGATSSGEAWINPTTATNNARILDEGTGPGQDEIAFWRQGTTNNLVVTVYGGTGGTTGGSVVATNALTQGQWQQVAFTLDGSGHVVIYKNGAQIATGTVPAARNVARSIGYLGRSLWVGDSYYDGGIADVALTGNVWTPAQISNHWYAAVGLPFYGYSWTATAPLQVCDSRLGMQNWWSYQDTTSGDQASAHVNVSNGNLVLSQTDSTVVQTHGRLAFVQRRYYNSQDTGALPGQTFARGWQLGMGHSDDLASAGLDALNLVVPTAETALQPLAVTLVDRTGTHLVFQPNVATWNPTSGGLTGLVSATTSALTPVSSVITNLAAGKALCLDVAYTSPPGIHLGLWRYVAIGGGGSCASPGAPSNAAVIGWVAERPDRLREEFAPSGELLDLIDPAGVDLRYVYDAAFGPVGTSTGNAHRLRAVYEPADSACTLTGTGASTSLGATCRGELLAYSGETPANASCTGLLTALGSPANWMCVLDPAGRPTLYGFDGADPTSRHLTGVADPDGGTTRYSYGTACSTAGAAGADQVCAVTDRRGSTTSFSYTSATDPSAFGTVANGALPVVSQITDRVGVKTFLGYGGGSATTVDTAPTSGTSSCSGNAGCQRQVFAAIDAAGRVGELDEAASNTGSNGPWLRTTLTSWDGGSRTCRSDGQVDNNVCELVRDSFTSTPNQDTSYRYDTAGELLDQHQVLSSGNLDSTFGYRLQQLHTDGVVSCADETVAGAGTVTSTANTSAAGCGSSTAPVLYTLADRTQALSPRGNAAGSGYATYLTTYRVDDLASSTPNSAPTGGVCGPTGAATSNTGLVCETDTPAAAGVSTPIGACQATLTGAAQIACTLYQYNSQGQKTAWRTPNAVVHGTAPYRYVYYTDSDLDLSGTVTAGGWLKAVVDPTASYGTPGDPTTATSHFVAFGYDRAGNQVRSWDRNATSSTAAAVSGYPTAGSSSFTETDYGPYPNPPAGATALSAPWRYPLSHRDQLAELTSTTVDLNGNPTRIRPPRGTQAGNASFDTTATYDNADQLLTRTLPLGSSDGSVPGTTSYSYDGFGNRTVVTDPNQHKTQSVFDAVNRLIKTRWDRTTDPAQAPAACPVASGDPTFANGTYVCFTASSYDGTDNLLAAQDGNGNTTTFSYDGVGRRTDTVTPRNNNSITTVHTATRYDADSHVTDSCTGREFTEGSGSCTSSSVYATHLAFDPAGHLSTQTRYRQAGQALTSCFGYDADGNQLSLTDPNGSSCGDPLHTTTAVVDALDRVTSRTVPRSSTLSETTSASYDPNGNTTALTPPTGADGLARTTAYSYDAANRLLDTVSAADNPVAASAGLPDAQGGRNIRTRRVYDVAGNIVGSYDPRAFQPYTNSSGVSVTDPRLAPNPDYLITTAFDQDNRPISQLVPRYDNGSNATNLSSQDPASGNAQLAQCPTGAAGYPATTGVCTTSVSYDAAGNRLTVTLPTATGGNSNRYLSYHYTDDNLPATVDAPNPAANGQRLNGSGGNPWAAQYRYDADGQRTHSLDALGRDTITTYTQDELVASVTAPPNGSNTHVSSTGYDAAGNPVSSTDALNETTTTTFTADNLTASLTDPAGDRTSYLYDNNGNPTTVYSPSANAADLTNPFGWPTSNTFTLDNLLASSTVPLAATSTTVGTGRRTDYSYDAPGRKTSSHTYTLNLARAGNTVTAGATLADGGTQTLAYLPDDRTASVTGRAVGSAGGTTSTTGTISYGYDPAGHPLSITDSTFSTANTATYYADGLPRTSSDGSRSSAYGYDGLGSLTYDGFGPTGSLTGTTSSYSDAEQPLSTSNGLVSGSWTWSYDTAGRPATGTQPNNTQLSWTFNNDDTLAEQLLSTGATTISDYTYSYDALYRISTQTLSSNSQSASAGLAAGGQYSSSYDPAGRIAAFTDTIPGTTTARTVHYSWDHDSNRVAFGATVTQGVGVTSGSPCTPLTQVTVCASYRPDDSLASQSDFNGVDHTISQDPAGRISTDACSTYAYDGLDRTAGVSNVTGIPCHLPTVSYSYDGLNRQTSHTETGTLGTANTTVRYDGFTPTVAEEQPTNRTGLPADITFAHTPGGTPLAALAGTNQQFLNSDGHHNTATVTNGSAGVVCTARYDAFGNPEPLNTNNTWDTTQAACATSSPTTPTISDLFYRQARHDTVLGDYQFGARTYDPSKGAFLTADSLTSNAAPTDPSIGTDPLTRNTYSYVNGDPLNLADPSGHSPTGAGTGDCAGWCNDHPWFSSPWILDQAISDTLAIGQSAWQGFKHGVEGLSADAVLVAPGLREACSFSDTCSSFVQRHSNVLRAIQHPVATIEGLERAANPVQQFIRIVHTIQSRGFLAAAKEQAYQLGAAAPGLALAGAGGLLAEGEAAAALPEAEASTATAEIGVAGGTPLADRLAGAAEEAGPALTRVGRWMSEAEHEAMSASRTVQEGAGGVTSVAHPADVEAFMSQAKSGTRYVEFDVPSSALSQGGKAGWASIRGPNSWFAKYGKALPEMPPAVNIEWIASRL